MLHIDLHLESPPESLDNYSFKLDNDYITPIVDNNILSFNVDCQYGFHMFTMLQHADIKTNITSIYLDDVNIDQTLYMGYMVDNNFNSHKRHQPQTAMWEKDQTLFVPFINPYSAWYSSVSEKLDVGDLGSDLAEKYSLYLPESTDIEGFSPNTTQFFKTSLDFHLHRKDDYATWRTNHDIPYIETTMQINTELLLEECKDYCSSEHFLSAVGDPNQIGGNSGKNNIAALSNGNPYLLPGVAPEDMMWTFKPLFDTNSDKHWKDTFYYKEKYPNMFAYYESLPLGIVNNMKIHRLVAGQEVPVHLDGEDGYILLLLVSEPHGHLKLNNVGIVPYEQGNPILLNNFDFTHSYVITGEEDWYCLTYTGTYGDDMDKLLKY